MKKLRRRPLQLDAQTIRTLKSRALEEARGGLYTAGQSCTCPPKITDGCPE